MSKPRGGAALAAVPAPLKERPAPAADQIPQDHAVLEMEGEYAGKWVLYNRRSTARQAIALLRGDEDFASALEVVGQRTVDHNFGGDIMDQDIRVALLIMKGWNRRQEADALDPKSGGG